MDFEDLDYYELLGVPRTATTDEVKRAFRREISKYHPDRFAQASLAEQDYAQRRSQRLTEAQAVLTDFQSRNAYNRGQPPPKRATPAMPTQPRDHQAELYDQAQAHLEAGRTLQAIGALRQLQQINPFYRDSASLLTAAEAELHRRQTPVPPARQRRGPRPAVIAGGIAGAAVVAATAWALRGRAQSGTTSTGTANIPTTLATSAPVAVIVTELPTASLLPTEVPVVEAATAAPATDVVPSVPVATSVVDVALSTPVIDTGTPEIESGTAIISDTFDTRRWAESTGPGWSVGYSGDRYRISAAPGIGTIWSYRSGISSDYTIGADIDVVRGEGGLLLRFAGAENYLAFIISPSQSSYRLEQHIGDEIRPIYEGDSAAIKPDGVNRVVARLRGSHVELFANGTELTDLDVDQLPSNTRYGLLAVSGDGPAEVLFDAIEIRAAQPN